MTTPEGLVKAAVKRALAVLAREYHFMPVQQGLGASTLDFLCCLDGKFVAIETKAPGKKLTARQLVVKQQIEDAGGQVFIVDDHVSLKAMVQWVVSNTACPTHELRKYFSK